MKKIKKENTMVSKNSPTLKSLQELKEAHNNMNGDIGKVSSFYNNWSDLYDKDVEEQQYIAPTFSAHFFLAFQKQVWQNPSDFHKIRIMDAGCGTGLSGLQLQKLGYTNINGCDIAQNMIDIAKGTNVYQSLSGDADINNLSAFANNQYDAVISCGVFTPGHVFPDALRELVRITKKSGFIVVVTRRSYYQSTNFQEVCDTLKQERLVSSITKQEGPYDMEERAYYWGIKL
ncbi:MAG: Ubiquinone/menaquinone biosynthesis protein [uncultured Aureispira sp.]|uniref:Ubiquinone/menaquinone biosynthesis protein n=1 Tax=uncultured Aureispira sp. TaxID=1331704 RepID=A0A6S6TYP7_9BACT|nr:MAG: Ubiquinone/menaquinone biosynthesis protein [uncultured Aureispira sp.]